MKIKGKTKSGLYVVSNTYYYYNTYGIPLEYIVLFLAKYGYIIDWLDLLSDAVDMGMKQSNIISKIRNATLDVYGKDISDSIIKRIHLCLKNSNILNL
tara:strand:+ start:598 stop:891 length:294 start_codon:yes stop_codon:yes gene_type:complete